MRFELSPEPGLIARTSKYAGDFYGTLLADAEASARVLLTTHELLENAAKYATDGVCQLHIELCDEAAGGAGLGLGALCIRSINRARPERLGDLRLFFEESARCPDAVALYDRMIARSTARASGSGLGLARIQAEAEMKLSYSLREDEVTITAEARVKVKQEPFGRRAGLVSSDPGWGGHGTAHD
jgi:two-component sensor histidine kinase